MTPLIFLAYGLALAVTVFLVGIAIVGVYGVFCLLLAPKTPKNS